VNAIFGAELSFCSMLIMTIGGSVLIGLVGIFTEHVGV